MTPLELIDKNAKVGPEIGVNYAQNRLFLTFIACIAGCDSRPKGVGDHEKESSQAH